MPPRLIPVSLDTARSGGAPNRTLSDSMKQAPFHGHRSTVPSRFAHSKLRKYTPGQTGSLPKPPPMLPSAVNQQADDYNAAARSLAVAVRRIMPVGGGSAVSRCVSNGNYGQLTPLVDLNDSKMYMVKLVSNWGSKHSVRIGTLMLLDDRMQQINIMSVKSIPSAASRTYETLRDGNLMKAVGDCWSAPWSEEVTGTPVVFVFYVDPCLTPRFLRIWNPIGKDESCVREVVIMEGEEEIGRGEIACGYGEDVPLNDRQSQQTTFGHKVLRELFPEAEASRRQCDDYGDYPMNKVYEVKIEVMSNYGNQTSIGLNAIELFDENDEVVDVEQIKNVRLESCLRGSRVMSLFRDNKRSILADEQWLATAKWDKRPAVVITLEQPMWITRVAVYNLNTTDETRSAGLQNIRMLVNGELAWVGRLQQGTGHIEDINDRAVDIWITDLPHTRQKHSEKETAETNQAEVWNQ